MYYVISLVSFSSLVLSFFRYFCFKFFMLFGRSLFISFCMFALRYFARVFVRSFFIALLR